MKMGLSNGNLSKITDAFFVAFPVLITFSVIYPTTSIAEARDLQDQADRVDQHGPDSGDYSSQPDDKLLQGLLVPGFDEGSCLSRYQAASCHKAILYHEALSSLLSQFTKLYNKTVKLLISILSSGPMVCQYIVWVLYGDLPNKMLTLASAFLYAPITN